MKFNLSVFTTAIFITSISFSSISFSEEEKLDSIQAFTDICLKTAPTFTGASKEAIAYGITEITDAGFMKMGFNKDQSLAVQIKDNKECVITTPSQSSSSLTKQFLIAVSEFTGAPISQKVPTKAIIQNETFIFLHDRDGGEAFVMLKK